MLVSLLTKLDITRNSSLIDEISPLFEVTMIKLIIELFYCHNKMSAFVLQLKLGSVNLS